jgi:PAS domain S-box-containing protein
MTREDSLFSEPVPLPDKEPVEKSSFEENELRKKEQLEQTRRADSRIEQAETRTEQAETRTEQAETRTEQAEARTEQAEARTEQAKNRTEHAEMRQVWAETQSEEAIRASELKYRRLFEAAKDGILILEVDSGKINDVNPYLMELLDFSHEELIGTPIWELGTFRDIVANQDKFRELQERGSVRYENLPLETKTGRKIAVEFVSNIYPVGNRNVIQCNVRDITERKQAQEQNRLLNAELEQRVTEGQQLEAQFIEAQKMEVVGHLAGGVAHDFNNILAVILGYSDLIAEELDPDSSLQKYVDEIRLASERATGLTGQLLVFSRKQTVQAIILDLNETVKSTENMLRRLIDENIEMTVISGKSLTPATRCPTAVNSSLRPARSPWVKSIHPLPGRPRAIMWCSVSATPEAA